MGFWRLMVFIFMRKHILRFSLIIPLLSLTSVQADGQTICILLLSQDLVMHTAISRKVVGKIVHVTIPKVNMGYDQYTVPNDCSCRTDFCCFPVALANICPWPLVPFFQFSLENRADKTTHNIFRDCRVHFFRQPFSKQLYISLIPI